MAQRPVFITKSEEPFFDEVSTTFTYFSGFAVSQKKKSVQSLHQAFLSNHRDSNILEVSRFSDHYLGQRLSAFNLLGTGSDGTQYPVENLFQSSKVFEHGGPFRDLLTVSPGSAKTDPRLKESGRLIRFDIEGEIFPLEPKTFFYDWIYINALAKSPDVTTELLQFDAFTDIVFNPQKSINCQARTIAIFVSLYHANILEQCLTSRDEFVSRVYGQQVTLF